MAKRTLTSVWAKIFRRSVATMTRNSMRVGKEAVAGVVKQATEKRKPPSRTGQRLAGVAMGAAGIRRYRLYRPPGVKFGEQLPLMVMLHGCSQDAKSFATSTRMNNVAARERFMVLYPRQGVESCRVGGTRMTRLAGGPTANLR